MSIFRRKSFLLLILFVTLAFFVTSESWARPVSRSSAQKHFTQRQASLLAQKLTKKLLSQSFFQDELGRRVALIVIPVSVPNSDVTDTAFTNMVLSGLLDSFSVSVMNQDPMLGGGELQYQLLSYDDEPSTRRRGLFMGADYIVTGFLRAVPAGNVKGKALLNLRAEIFVKDIRTGAVLLNLEQEGGRL